MFHNQKDFPSAYSIIKSKNFDCSSTKIEKDFKSIKETGDFAPDNRSVRSPIKKLNKESLIYLTSELSKDNTLSLLEMKKLLLDKFDIKISRTVIGGRLKELGYWYQGPKVRPKTQILRKQKDLIGVKDIRMIIGEYSFLLMKQQFIWIIHDKIDGLKKARKTSLLLKIKEER